jgi:hypothetical protein
VSSTTGLIFSYLLGAIFAVGGILFMILLDERRFLFGIPYLLIGLLLIGGVRGSQRRKKTRADATDQQPSAPSEGS